MDVVGHQAVRMDARAILDCQLPQMKKIKDAVVIPAEAGAPISRSLDYVRGDTGNKNP